MWENVVTCSCGARFSAAAHLAGRTVECPTCHAPLVVPALIPPAEPVGRPGHGAPPRTLGQAPARPPVPTVMVIGVTLGALLVGAVIVFHAVRSLVRIATTDRTPRPTTVATSPSTTTTTSLTPTTSKPVFALPRLTGRPPVDPCEWRMPDKFVAASPGNVLVPIGGNSPLALEMPPIAKPRKLQIVDLRTDERRLAAVFDPFADVDADVDEAATPASLQIAAGSPSGQHVAIIDPSRRESPVEIWSTDTPPRLVAKVPGWTGPASGRAVFIPNDEWALVAKSLGELEWWSLKNGQPLAAIPGGIVTPTPGQRFLSVARQDTVEFLDATSRATVASITLGRGQLQHLKGVGFRADGRMMVVHGDGVNGQSQWLELWDLDAAKSVCLIPFPGRFFLSAEPYWLDDDLVLIGTYVFSASQRQVIYQYEKPPQVQRAAGGRPWARAADVTDTIWYPVVAPNLQERGGAAALGKQAPTILNLEQPVELTIDLSGAQASAKQRDEIVRVLRERLIATGHDTQASGTTAPVIQVTLTDVPGTGTMTFEYVTVRQGPTVGDRERGTGKKIILQHRELRCAVTIPDRQGGVAWSTNVTVGLDDVHGLVDVGLFSSGENAVYDARWSVMQGRLKGLPIPFALVDYRQLAKFEWTAQTPPADWVVARKRQIAKAVQANRESNKDPVEIPLESPKRFWEGPIERLAADQPLDAAGILPIDHVKLVKGGTTDLRFSRASAGLLLHVTSPPNRSLVKYDLHRNGQATSRALADHLHLLDMRPDGSLYLLGDANQRSLQLWKCASRKSGQADGGQKNEVEQDNGGQEVNRGQEDSLAIELAEAYAGPGTRAWFVGRDRVLVESGTELVARRLPGGDVAWRQPLGPGGAAPSDDREWFVTWRDNALRVHRSSDGSEIGHCQSPAWSNQPGKTYDFAWAAFHPKLPRLTAAFSDLAANSAARSSAGSPTRSRWGMLVTWDLTDGRLISSFQRPNIGVGGLWCSPAELLVDEILFDVESESAEWKYPRSWPSSPDGRAWLSEVDPQLGDVLRAVVVPSPDVRAAIEATKSRKPIWLNDIDSVALRLRVGEDFPLHEAFETRLAEQVRKWADEAGVRLDNDAKVALRIDALTSLDPKYAYRAKGEGQELIVPKRRFALSWRVEGADSPFSPNGALTTELTNAPYRLDPQSADPDQDASRIVQEALFAEFTRISILRRYGASYPGFGQSIVNANGEKVISR